MPIGGHEDTVYKRYLHAVDEVHAKFPNEALEIVGPINIKDFSENGLEKTREHAWSWYISHDIERLLECDAIFMTKGHKQSKGCRIELVVAQEADLHVYYSENSDKTL